MEAIHSYGTSVLATPMRRHVLEGSIFYSCFMSERLLSLNFLVNYL
jgi:hypothetical protein